MSEENTNACVKCGDTTGTCGCDTKPECKACGGEEGEHTCG